MYVTPFKITTFVILICVSICLSFDGTANGQMLSPDVSALEQIVVLRNGEIIKGQITRTSEQTIVQTEQGSRLVLSKDQVDFVCNTMIDAYWGKSARTKATDITGQKSLFYWCLKHKMTEQAQNQIALMAETDGVKASDVEVLDRQLNVALEQLRNKRKAKQQIAQKRLPNANFNSNPRAIVGNSQAGVRPWSNNVANNGALKPIDGANRNLSLSKPSFLQPIEIQESIGAGELAGNFDYNSFQPLPEFDSPELNSPELNSPQPNSFQTLPAALPTSLPTLNADGQFAASPLPRKPLTVLPGKRFEQPAEADDSSSVRQVGFEEPIEDSSFQANLNSNQFANPSTNAPNLSAPKPDLMTADAVTSQPHKSVAEKATNAELDKMTRAMPDGTLGPYRSNLERTMINGCAKCHHTEADVMPLWNLGRAKPLTRRMSQRNLYQTLQHINRADPFASPLLKAASSAHGGLEKAVIPEGSKKFNQMLLWVIMLSDDPENNFFRYNNPQLEPQHSTYSSPDSPTNSPIDLRSELPSFQGTIVPVKPEPIGFRPIDSAADLPSTIGDIPDLNTKKSIYKPVDAFDPEIFNRQFGDQDQE